MLPNVLSPIAQSRQDQQVKSLLFCSSVPTGFVLLDVSGIYACFRRSDGLGL